jgi:Tfp pilus assembly protein PilV
VRHRASGLTVAEVVVAVVVLTVGLLALVGSFARMSRMAGAGRHATVAAMAAGGRLAWLHQVAHSSSPPCTGPEWRSDSGTSGGFTESWRILDAAGTARRVELVVRHQAAARVAADTVVTAVLCGPS